MIQFIIPKRTKRGHAARAVFHYVIALVFFLMIVNEADKTLCILGFIGGVLHLLLASLNAASAVTTSNE